MWSVPLRSPLRKGTKKVTLCPVNEVTVDGNGTHALRPAGFASHENGRFSRRTVLYPTHTKPHGATFPATLGRGVYSQLSRQLGPRCFQLIQAQSQEATCEGFAVRRE